MTERCPVHPGGECLPYHGRPCSVLYEPTPEPAPWLRDEAGQRHLSLLRRESGYHLPASARQRANPANEWWIRAMYRPDPSPSVALALPVG